MVDDEDTMELLELWEADVVLDRLELDLLEVVTDDDETGLVDEDETLLMLEL